MLTFQSWRGHSTIRVSAAVVRVASQAVDLSLSVAHTEFVLQISFIDGFRSPDIAVTMIRLLERSR